MSGSVERPLAVDLDGSLIKTDLLQETASSFICRNPLQLPKLLFWLCAGGLCKLKAKLAENYKIDVTTLPWNQSVLTWLWKEKSNGRHLVLATASHISLAQQIQQHLQLFDEVLATENKTNLRRQHKEQALITKYGEHGFDYLGNSRDDLKVWRSARQAYVVSDSDRLIVKAGEVSHVKKVFSSERPAIWKSIMIAIRPHQWLKNILLVVPLMTSHTYNDIQNILLAGYGFAIFCLCASGIYVLNDLVDCNHDRYHASKSQRPFAASDLSLATGWLLGSALLLAAILLALLLLPPAFNAALYGYMLLALGYSVLLKKIVIVDVLVLALLYTIRVIAGVAAINAELSFWLLLFSMFIFLSLALVKRCSELLQKADNPDDKVHGRGYIHDDLEAISTMGISSAMLAVLVLAFYIQDGDTTGLYQSPEFIWLACPVLLYWILRIWLLTHRGQMHHDPIAFAIADINSWLSGALFVGVFAMARFIP